MDPLFYQAQIDNLKAELAELRLALRLLVPVGGERMSPYSQFLQPWTSYTSKNNQKLVRSLTTSPDAGIGTGSASS